MTPSTLDDAFAHHVWATLLLMDECLKLPPEQLATTVPGTYGSILDTMRHIVGADASTCRDERRTDPAASTKKRWTSPSCEQKMERPTTRRGRRSWRPTDADRMLTRHRDDGSSTEAPVSIRLAQALHHGTDHRSQICTALTSLGVEPPFIDVWDYGAAQGRVVETPPS